MKVLNGELKTIIGIYNKLMVVTSDNYDEAMQIVEDYLKLEEVDKKVNKLLDGLKEKYSPKEGDDIKELEVKINNEYVNIMSKEVEIPEIEISIELIKTIKVAPLEILTLKKHNIIKY